MEPYKCPHCQSEMKKIKEPDISTDKCPSCSGIFLEKGELNVLATGMKGNIEYSSVFADDSEHIDKFPIRICPKCPDQKMKKVELLVFSDIIFDFCENCESFFLDKGEIKAMNKHLKELTPYKVEQEYRAYHDDHLVCIDRRQGVYIAGRGLAGMRTHAVGGVNIKISVYLKKPLKIDLRVFQEHWLAQFTKSLGIYKVSDIKTGNDEFDKMFRVQGEDEKAVVETLSDDFRKNLVDFVSKGLKIYTRNGKTEVTSNLISYSEGPYEPDKKPKLMDKSEPIVQELLKLANLLESTN
jgi:Zn-finger nucleic acid-binding protein